MRTLLVTGGTGTVGSAVANYYLTNGGFDKIIVFSRDEFKQWQMRKELNDPRMRFFIGDVRDKERLMRAMEGVDTVVHCAALKQIDTGAYNPVEFTKTNVNGSINVVEAALDNNIRRLVAISTDKAVEPCCLYGATKLVMEGIVLHAKAYIGPRATSFAVVRMGNIVGSRGSIIPYFNSLAHKRASLPITSMQMTRYWVTQDSACKLIDEAIHGDGEVYTPPAIAFDMPTLVAAYSHPHHIVGLRDQERLYEKLDAKRSSNDPDMWVSIDEIRKEIERVG